MLQDHLQGAVFHLPLDPVDRLALLERKDREAVPALSDGPVRLSLPKIRSR
jgi:hypothetical protein